MSTPRGLCHHYTPSHSAKGPTVRSWTPIRRPRSVNPRRHSLSPPGLSPPSCALRYGTYTLSFLPLKPAHRSQVTGCLDFVGQLGLCGVRPSLNRSTLNLLGERCGVSALLSSSTLHTDGALRGSGAPCDPLERQLASEAEDKVSRSGRPCQKTGHFQGSLG